MRNQRRKSPCCGVGAYLLGGVILLLGTLLFGVCLFVGIRSFFVFPLLCVELGEDFPPASAFLSQEGTADYLEETESAPSRGLHWLTVVTDGTHYPVLALVRDTVAPTALPKESTFSTRQNPSPDSLVDQLRDADLVRVSYLEKPDFATVGDYSALLLLEDVSGNRTKLSVPVHVRVAVDALTLEAGSPCPTASDFLTDDYPVTAHTEITEQMLRTPDDYTVSHTVEGVSHTTVLHVVDTVAPTATVYSLFASPDELPEPEQFLESVTDETQVTVSFVTAPDPTLRTTQMVELLLVDLGGNRTTVSAPLLLTRVTPRLVEAREEALLISECLTPNSYQEAVFLSSFVPNTPGTYALDAIVDGEENVAVVTVVDTVPPVLSASDARWFTDSPVLPDHFVSVSDVTETMLSYETEPDWSSTAPQTVTVVGTDLGGNKTSASFTLTLSPDTEPPKLFGVKNRYYYTNEAIAYFQEVSATDNCDEEVTITVDNAKVDYTREGKCTVTYTATDRAGNETSASCTFTFVESTVSEAETVALAKEVLDRILTEDMSLAAQIEAIYDYVFENVRYVSTSDKTDWRKEAKRGITTGRGDCFTFYAVARLLLEQTDAEYLSVERLSSKTRHYWLLVNIGTGWYHFDTCNVGRGEARCFMWTNQQTSRESGYFWRYREELYPPVATTKYSKAEAEAWEKQNENHP